ncbi:hypothetical protein FRC18_011101 [Serendipita sp. 400]|nr:hypothetical protein FRC18_011101 [Serendipita sp. 400]
MSTIDLGNLVGSYNDHLSAVLPKAVGSNLVIWSAGSFATVLLFNILRPRNKIVYEPKTKYQTDEKAPPPINNGFFSWVKPLWSTPESVLLDKVGLDGVTFLRFLRMMSWIFLFVSVITCGALIPINVAYNRKYVDEQKRNTLSILTVQDVEGKTLFFHVAASYLINIIVLAFIWYNWKKMVALRHAWFRSDDHIAQYVKFLDTWQTDSQWTFALVNGILPPAIVSFFGFFLPKIMRRLSKYQGDITRSRLDRAVVARYFAFLIISQLFIFSLLGVGFQLVTKIVIKVQNQQNVWDILKDVKGLPGDIQSTYISQAPYWLTFFPLRGFLAVFDLAQLLQLALVWIKTRLFGRTPRDIIEYTKCPEFEYSIYYSNLLFMGAVGLVYAPLAPLVALAAAAVFWLSVLVYKYQIMFVFVSKVESGGRLWNPIVNRLLSSLVFMQLLMTLTIGLTHGWRSYYWVSCLPPLLLVAGCKVWFARTFMRRFRYYIPTDQEIANAVVHSGKADNTGNRLERRFGHPALHADLFTPLLHKKMMPLLAEVYNGRLGTDSATMEEYGGKKMQAQIAPGGIKIAGVDESGFYAPSGRNVPAGYDQYMQQGPMRTGTPGAGGLTVNSYEMSRRGASEANLPLLAARSEVSVGGHQGYESQHSLHERSPSVGPQVAYGASPITHDAPSGYFQSPPYGHQAYPPPPHDASEAAARYHARANSAGFEQAISPATGYPPQQHYVERSQSPSIYQQRSGSAMGYHQQSPSRGYTPSDQGPPSRYYTPSPTMHQDPNDYNMAGRGARGQNY